MLALEAQTLTVGPYLDRWLRDSVEGTVSRHTYRDYQDKVKLHLKPSLGRIRLRDLTTLHLQSLYRQKIEDGLSSRSVRYIHVTIRKALEQAEAWDLVRKNVARFAKPPKAEHSERRYLTPEQAKRFLEAITGHRDEALYLVAVTTGLRRGELLGLKWTDLDLNERVLRVERSLDTYYGPATENAPKRKSSRRPASLFPEVVEALKAHRIRQLRDKLRAGPRWKEHGYVFPTSVGTGNRGDNVLKRSLKPLVAANDLPPITFHELRHSCATFLALLGVHPRTAQRILGHGSIATTLEAYTHVLDEMHQDASDKLRELFFGEVE